MFKIDEFEDWRASYVTIDLYKDLTNAIEIAAAELINRRLPDNHGDTYLRGYIAGLTQSLTWVPKLVDEDGNTPEPDALREDAYEA